MAKKIELSMTMTQARLVLEALDNASCTRMALVPVYEKLREEIERLDAIRRGDDEGRDMEQLDFVVKNANNNLVVRTYGNLHEALGFVATAHGYAYYIHGVGFGRFGVRFRPKDLATEEQRYEAWNRLTLAFMEGRDDEGP
jgi:hypothetical protein